MSLAGRLADGIWGSSLLPDKGSCQRVLWTAWCITQAIKNLCREVGITRNDTEIPLHKLDHHIRADLDGTSERVLAVLRPLKLVLTNLPEDYSHTVEAKVKTSPPVLPMKFHSAVLVAMGSCLPGAHSIPAQYGLVPSTSDTSSYPHLHAHAKGHCSMQCFMIGLRLRRCSRATLRAQPTRYP